LADHRPGRVGIPAELAVRSTASPEAAGFDVSDGNTDNFHGDWRAVGDKRPLPEDDPKRVFSVTRRAGDFMAQQLVSEQLRAAGAQDRERLLRQIEQHQRAIQGHEAALERVEKGRTARW